jgi:hypothetical protein
MWNPVDILSRFGICRYNTSDYNIQASIRVLSLSFLETILSLIKTCNLIINMLIALMADSMLLANVKILLKKKVIVNLNVYVTFVYIKVFSLACLDLEFHHQGAMR